MASSHRIDSSVRLGVIRFWGNVDGKQLISECRRFFESGQWGRGYRVVWDARDVLRLDLVPDDVQAMRELIDEFRPRIGPGRSAIVGHSPDVLTSGHLLKVLAARDPQRQVEVFDDMRAALRWLGLREEAHDQVPGAIRSRQAY